MDLGRDASPVFGSGLSLWRLWSLLGKHEHLLWQKPLLTGLLLQYASGATVQILLFATLAIELKKRAPNAHTFLEVIRARYGMVTCTRIQSWSHGVSLTHARPRHSHCVYLLWPLHQHSCHGYAFDWRFRSSLLLDRNAHGSSLFLAPCGCRHLHNVWRVRLPYLHICVNAFRTN